MYLPFAKGVRFDATLPETISERKEGMVSPPLAISVLFMVVEPEAAPREILVVVLSRLNDLFPELNVSPLAIMFPANVPVPLLSRVNLAIPLLDALMIGPAPF